MNLVDPEDPSAPTISGAAFVMHLEYSSDVVFKPGEVKILKTGVSVYVQTPTAVCVSSHRGAEDNPFEAQFTVLHTQDECDNITVRVKNSGPVSESPRDEHGVRLSVFGLPLKTLAVNPLHLFHCTSGSAENTRPAHAAARVSIKRSGDMWTTRLYVGKLRWQRSSNGTESRFVVPVVFDSKPVPLDRVDGIQPQMCSQPGLRIAKAETLGASSMTRLYLEHESHLGPPNSVFMQFYFYANGANLVMRSNPEPLLERHPSNGFIVRCPKRLVLSSGRIASVSIDNAYDSAQESVGIFFPKTIPGLDLQLQVWREKTRLSLELKASENVQLNHLDPLGYVHFFPEESFESSNRSAPAGQYRIKADIRYPHTKLKRDPPEDTDDEDDDEEEDGDEDEDDADPRSRTPDILRQAARQAREDSDRDDDDDDGDENVDDQILTLDPCDIAVHVGDLIPLTYHIPATNSRRSRHVELGGWSNVIVFPDLLGQWITTTPDGRKIVTRDHTATPQVPSRLRI